MTFHVFYYFILKFHFNIFTRYSFYSSEIPWITHAVFKKIYEYALCYILTLHKRS